MPITFAEPASGASRTNNNNLNDVGVGPLKDLYSNEFKPNILQYPSDLGSTQKGHMVVFTACTTSGSGYDQKNTYSAPSNVSQAGSSLLKPGDLLKSGLSLLKGLGSNLQGSTTKVKIEVDQKVDLTWQPARKRSGDVISLYMPDTVNFSYNSSYTNLSLKDAAADAVKAVAGAIGNKHAALAQGAISAVDSPIAKLGLNALGSAINPMNQLVFDGIDFRSFQMAFQFTPRNLAESQQIKNIIKTFRGHAAPLIETGVGGMLFTVPDSFIIQFIQVGNPKGENPWVTKVKESVLEHIDVNYSPNGIWSTHPDGSPTQINLTLGFKEIELIDRAAINKGF